MRNLWSAGRVHRFAAICDHCRVPVREIGKVESAARGTATKGIAFVVGIVVLALAAMALGNHAAQSSYSLVAAIPMAITAFALGVNGLHNTIDDGAAIIFCRVVVPGVIFQLLDAQ